MSNRMTEFNTELHTKMNSLKKRLDTLMEKSKTEMSQAKGAVQDRIDTIEGGVKAGRTRIDAARQEISEWVDEAQTTVSDWQAKHEHIKLETRAKRADKYADASFDIAIDAIENAEKAMLQAWLAHADLNKNEEGEAA